MLYQNVLPQVRDTDTLVTENRPLYGNFLSGWCWTHQALSHAVWKPTLLGLERRLQAGSTTAPAARGKARRKPRSPPRHPPRPYVSSPAGGHRLHLLQFDLCSTFCSGSTQAETQVQGEGAEASHAPLQTRRKLWALPPVVQRSRDPGSRTGAGGRAQARRKREHGGGKGRAAVSRSPPPSHTAPSLPSARSLSNDPASPEESG